MTHGKLSHLQINVTAENLPFYRELFTLLDWDSIVSEEWGEAFNSAGDVSLWFMAGVKDKANDYDGPGVNHIGLAATSQAEVDRTAAWLAERGLARLFRNSPASSRLFVQRREHVLPGHVRIAGRHPLRACLHRSKAVSEIDLYVHPTCTSCRNAQTWLDERSIPYERRDYFRDRFTRDELADILATAGLTPRDLLSKRARAHKELLGDRELSDDQLLDLMIQEPTLLRRPLIVSGHDTVIGFDRKGLERLTGS